MLVCKIYDSTSYCDIHYTSNTLVMYVTLVGL